MAVSSAKNLELENTGKMGAAPLGPVCEEEAARIAYTASAVLTVKVLFSTKIVWPLAQAAT